LSSSYGSMRKAMYYHQWIIIQAIRFQFSVRFSLVVSHCCHEEGLPVKVVPVMQSLRGRSKSYCDLSLLSCFLPRDSVHKCGLCHHAVSVCLSVCLWPSIRLSSFMYSVKTYKHRFKKFLPSGSHIILVFPYQTLWQYSNGDPPNGV